MNRALGTVALLVLLAACTGSSGDNGSSPRPTLKVAFFEDGSIEGAQAHVAPAYQGVRLALELASTNQWFPAIIELDLFDDGGDVATAIAQAQQVAADPSYVAAVVGPFFSEPPALSQALAGAGIPTLSLSTLGPNGGTDWFRVVATLAEEAGSIASYLRRLSSRICLIGDGSAYSTELAQGLSSDLGREIRLRTDILEPTEIPNAVDRVRSRGCTAVVWTGMGTGAALLKLALVQSNLGSLPFITGDGAKDPAFISEAGAAGKGTIAFCPCADLSTSTDMTAQRFIHNFQSSYGVAPGAFGVEGYDTGRMIVEAMSSDATTREATLAAVRRGFPFDGLANSYAMAATGELQGSSVHVKRYVDVGMRWLPGRRSRGPA
jgi:branched-chain amino acid transport system substrate-binding protein